MPPIYARISGFLQGNFFKMYGWTMASVVKVKIAPRDANEVIEMVG